MLTDGQMDGNMDAYIMPCLRQARQKKEKISTTIAVKFSMIDLNLNQIRDLSRCICMSRSNKHI